MIKLRIGIFLVYAFVLVCITPSLDSQIRQEKAAEIHFTAKTYSQVVAQAKKSHKKIFVDVNAQWCGPCKALQKTTFKDAKAAAYFNKNFINISIDIETGNGPDLALKWGVEGLPALLILDQNGKVLASHTGYVDGAGLLEFAKEAKGRL